MDSTTFLNIDISKFLPPEASRAEVDKKCCLTLLNMLEEGSHTDITMIAQGGSVQAHRSVLATVSPVFKAMFKHNMKEQLTSSVELLDMTIESLQFFLLLLYAIPDNTTIATQEFQPAVDKHFHEIFEACCKYQVTRLVLTLYFAIPHNVHLDHCWKYTTPLVGIYGNDLITEVSRITEEHSTLRKNIRYPG